MNHWYDMEGRGMAWVWMNFLRGVEDPPLGNAVDAPDSGESAPDGPGEIDR